MIHTGRHFLQIPGPTNVPDRVLRAMDRAVMDHRLAEVLGVESQNSAPFCIKSIRRIKKLIKLI